MVRLQIRVITAILIATMILAAAYPVIAKATPTEWEAQPMHHIQTASFTPNAVAGFSPSTIINAYGLSNTGSSSPGTIAIIDAYDNPYVTSNLATFSTQFGLPQANLEVHKMSSYIQPNAGWGMEISLDVQWAHAIAPNAKILLVEARSAYLSDLLSAVSYASNRADVVAVSMSWGGYEFSTETAYDSYFSSSHSVAYFASSGDSGAGTSWPSVSPNVISVGGTTLTLSGGVVSSETGWAGSGGGVSTYEAKPGYQSGLTAYGNRATPDISYNADPNTGYAVYDSYGYGGWNVVGGTSAGAPQWAAIQALGTSATNTNFYNDNGKPGYFTDITSGSNGAYSCTSGYDLVTGIGSPLTVNFGAPPTPDFSISASPNTFTMNTLNPTPVTSTITVKALNGFTDTVNLAASAPTGLSATITPTSDPSTSTLTIAPSTGFSAGQYTVTVTGTIGSGTITHSTTINVKVVTPDYTLTANPTSLSISLRQGGTGTSRITVNAVNGYAGTVTFTTTGPAGLTYTYKPTSASPGSPTTLTVKATQQVSGTIIITGIDADKVTHTTTISINVRR